jgi:hypothetical protein
MLVGMQLRIGITATTIGPAGFPIRGSISSTHPTAVLACVGELETVQFEFVS